MFNKQKLLKLLNKLETSNCTCNHDDTTCEYCNTFVSFYSAINNLPEWKPIETAPKDKQVLIVHNYNGSTGYILDIDFYKSDRNQWTYFNDAIAWYPLPWFKPLKDT